MDKFTATGRPFKEPSERDKAAGAFDMVAVGDGGGGFGATGPANILPVRYTDESLISVPVLPPGQIGRAPEEKKKHFWSSRRSSRNSDFIIKEIPRGDYLKYYAKDDDGAYIGTEDPAKDCILKGDDYERYRGAGLTFSNDLGGGSSKASDVVR